jgi:SNF2 family DNA or RNA helicase
MSNVDRKNNVDCKIATSIIDTLQATPYNHKLIDGTFSKYLLNIDGPPQYDVCVNLNDKFAKIEKIPGLKTSLYPHQQTTVKAMIDLECCRCYQQIDSQTKKKYKISYNAGVLSEPTGSGKTIDVLAVVCYNKLPRMIPDIMQFRLVETNNKFTGYIRRSFKKILNPTLIFVGASVVRQWGNRLILYN